MSGGMKASQAWTRTGEIRGQILILSYVADPGRSQIGCREAQGGGRAHLGDPSGRVRDNRTSRCIKANKLRRLVSPPIHRANHERGEARVQSRDSLGRALCTSKVRHMGEQRTKNVRNVAPTKSGALDSRVLAGCSMAGSRRMNRQETAGASDSGYHTRADRPRDAKYARPERAGHLGTFGHI